MNSDLRQFIHFGCGGGAFLLYYFPAWVVITILLAGVLLSSLANYRRLDHKLLRTGEGIVFNGATWYAVGTGLAVVLFPAKAAFVGWLVLATGDSASAVVGSRFPLIRFRNGLSLGGCLAFVLFGTTMTMAGVTWWSGQFDSGYVTRLLFVNVVCAMVELSGIGNDNLYLPAVAACLFLLVLA